MIHELKCFPEYFQDVIDGKKTFEIRLHDRPYQVGDLLALNEYLPDLLFWVLSHVLLFLQLKAIYPVFL